MEIDIFEEITKYFEQPQFAATKDIHWRWQVDSLTVTRDAIISFARYFLNLGIKFTKNCKLEEISTENLRTELKRRIAINKELKTKEMAEAESIINTLEVKDVDLEKEIDDWYNNIAPKEFTNVHYDNIEQCARYFFELGLKAMEE